MTVEPVHFVDIAEVAALATRHDDGLTCCAQAAVLCSHHGTLDVHGCHAYRVRMITRTANTPSHDTPYACRTTDCRYLA